MFRVSEYRARSALPLATEETQETRLSLRNPPLHEISLFSLIDFCRSNRGTVLLLHRESRPSQWGQSPL